MTPDDIISCMNDYYFPSVPASPQPSSADQDSDPSGTDTSFIENGVKELLKARRVLKASYPYGYYLQDGMHRKMLFEAMQVCDFVVLPGCLVNMEMIVKPHSLTAFQE